ncbi:5909_t:CDS:1, partial [Acaulospora colombiana]
MKITEDIENIEKAIQNLHGTYESLDEELAPSQSQEEILEQLRKITKIEHILIMICKKKKVFILKIKLRRLWIIDVMILDSTR